MKIHSFTSKLEKIASINHMTCKLYLSLYRKAVLSEIRSANINKNDKILIIGGGAIPYTGIIMSEYAKEVTIIDRDKEAVEIAKMHVKKLRITNVTLIQCCGENIDASNFSKIFIPLQAEPKCQILNKLKGTAMKNTEIIIRLPKERFAKTYTSHNELPIKNFQISTDVNQITFDKTLFCLAKDIISNEAHI